MASLPDRDIFNTMRPDIFPNFQGSFDCRIQATLTIGFFVKAIFKIPLKLRPSPGGLSFMVYLVWAKMMTAQLYLPLSKKKMSAAPGFIQYSEPTSSS
jgi:hypothetical protein